MIKKIILSFYFLLILISIGNSQEIQKISGHITALNDSLPIPYAHIGILGTGIGTVSNMLGQFEFKGDFNFETDSLTISHIEYEQKRIAFKDLLTETIHIHLKKNEYELGEIIVLPKEKVKEIFKNVIKNLKKNYPTKLYQCEAFYREIQYEQRSKKYNRLIEAAINIQDGKVSSPTSKIKCSVLQLRKSDNYTQEHWGSKVMRSFFTLPNDLHDLLKMNPTRIYKESLHKEDMYCNPLKWVYENKKGSISLKRLIKKKDHEIYVFHYERGSELYFDFYINKKDYALLRYDEELKGIQKKTYHFKKIGEKYYPSFFKSENIQGILKNSKGLSMTICTLSFVNYSPDRKNFKRLRSRHTTPKNIDLYEQDMEYDETFWANYNILLKEPLNEKIISDLEKEESLSTQFKKNAKTKP